ncbi:MAG TPA: hypothetical protein VIV60_00250 [Polyangiaceae bacterium]
MSEALLVGLNDITGVVGSFVLASSGEFKLKHLPGVVSSEDLEEVGPRLALLLEAFAQDAPVETCSLRFTQHRLMVRPAGPWLLCVLAEPAVNLPALQMGMTLVARKLATRQLDAPAPNNAPAPDSGASPPASAAALVAAAPSPAPVPRRNFLYRGQRVE